MIWSADCPSHFFIRWLFSCLPLSLQKQSETGVPGLPSFFWRSLSSGAECIQEWPAFHTSTHLDWTEAKHTMFTCAQRLNRMFACMCVRCRGKHTSPQDPDRVAGRGSNSQSLWLRLFPGECSVFRNQTPLSRKRVTHDTLTWWIWTVRQVILSSSWQE